MIPKFTLEYRKNLEHSFYVGTMEECIREQKKLEKQGYKTRIL